MGNMALYWVWFQQAIGYGNKRVKYIFQNYENIKEFYNSKSYGWRLCGCFTNSQISKLENTSLNVAYKILEKCYKLGYEVIDISDNRYPELLREIANPPSVLYLKGNDLCLKNSLNFSLVGTRKPSIYGVEVAKSMAKQVCYEGGTVISGGAIGIDSAAHEGALEIGGKTISVLGCAINYEYSAPNACLKDKIINKGALISEYPPDYPPSIYTFPMRNRIISGLSLATIVVEAGGKSGSLITANLANEQNRDVFVAPVDIENPLSKGIVSLINDGVKVISDISSLVKSYKTKYDIKLNNDMENHLKKLQNESIKEKIKSTNKNFDNLEGLSENAKMVYSFMLDIKKASADELCKISKLHIKNILSALTELEIYGLVESKIGNFELIQ